MFYFVISVFYLFAVLKKIHWFIVFFKSLVTTPAVFVNVGEFNRL